MVAKYFNGKKESFFFFSFWCILQSDMIWTMWKTVLGGSYTRVNWMQSSMM